jgi:hypothetical protein
MSHDLPRDRLLPRAERRIDASDLVIDEQVTRDGWRTPPAADGVADGLAPDVST